MCDRRTASAYSFPREGRQYAYSVEPLPLRKFWKYSECGGRPRGPPSSKNLNERLPKTTGKWRVSPSPDPPPGQGWAGGLQHLVQLCLHLTQIPECRRQYGPWKSMLSQCVVFGGDRKHASHVRENRHFPRRGENAPGSQFSMSSL